MHGLWKIAYNNEASAIIDVNIPVNWTPKWKPPKNSKNAAELVTATRRYMVEPDGSLRKLDEPFRFPNAEINSVGELVLTEQQSRVTWHLHGGKLWGDYESLKGARRKFFGQAERFNFSLTE